MIGKQAFGCDALEDPYNLANVVLGVKAYQEMDMVLVISKLFYFQVVPLFNTPHGITNGHHDFRTQKSPPVSHGKHKVVMGVVCAVVSFGD